MTVTRETAVPTVANKGLHSLGGMVEALVYLSRSSMARSVASSSPSRL